MPKPTAHIIDRFHIAMKIQPMQQIAGHLSRSNSDRAGELPSIHGDVSTLKWRLRHARVDRVVRDLERLLARLKNTQREGEFSIARLHRLALQLLTYVRSNNYGKRYRAGLRVATTLAESAVNSLVGKRMVKKQQMRWSFHGAHMLMQVRTAEINGDPSQSIAGTVPTVRDERAFTVQAQATPSARRLTPQKLPVSWPDALSEAEMHLDGPPRCRRAGAPSSCSVAAS